MEITCMFEKSYELLENLFPFWCDRVTDGREFDTSCYEDKTGIEKENAKEKRSNAFYSFFNAHPELLTYADYYIGDNEFTIEFSFDEEEYTKSKEEFENLVKSFGCFEIEVTKD